MENPIKQIYKFNQQANLLTKGYNPRLEAAFQIEEALEGFDIHQIATSLFGPQTDILTAKDLARAIISQDTNTSSILSVDALDKAGDGVVYGIGAMAKLGLDVQGITQALNIIMNKNLAKLKALKYDEQGKLLKPEAFEGPEEELQKLLDKYSTPE